MISVGDPLGEMAGDSALFSPAFLAALDIIHSDLLAVSLLAEGLAFPPPPFVQEAVADGHSRWTGEHGSESMSGCV